MKIETNVTYFFILAEDFREIVNKYIITYLFSTLRWEESIENDIQNDNHCVYVELKKFEMGSCYIFVIFRYIPIVSHRRTLLSVIGT